MPGKSLGYEKIAWKIRQGHIFLKQEASNKKVIINIDASTGIGKSYEAESFCITIQMYNSVQASENV